MDNEFESLRGYLFGIAYRMLASVSDAEDIVQDAYLRYASTSRDSTRSVRAFLTTIVTRLCLNQLQSARARRETYVGSWLPEPYRTDIAGASNHLADIVGDEESISMAFLVLLERLTPIARAVFLLREVFDYEYSEIADIVERDETTCRQIFSRARRELSREQTRFKPSREDQERILHSFMRAVTQGDMAALKDVLSEDIVVWADGGGKVRGAATRPLYGRDAAATFLVSSRRFVPSEATTYEIAMLNAELGVILRVDGRPLVSMSFEINDDRIAAMRLVANPDKLSGIDR